MIKMPRRIIFALFLLSGMTGLIYQVVWTKLLTLVFGVTILAVSTVLTSFFGGLALGSYVGGRWIDRRGNGFKWYGAAETLVGVYALVFPALITVNNSVYVSIAHAASPGFYGQSLLKFALSVLLLIIPATLMGATLPILSKTLARSDARFAKDVGGLYAVNTAGAVIGAVLTAFILIPSIGQKTILYLAGFLNIAIGVCAILAGRAYNGDEAVSGKDAAGQGSPAHASRGRPGEANATGSAPAYQAIPGYYASLLIWGFAFSGFTGLAYEVIWTRVLGFMLIGTVYAFAAVLAVFLTGIAAGSFVFSRFADRVRSVSTLILILAAVEALIGITSIGLIGLYDKLPSFGFYRAVESTPVWSEFLFLNFLTSFITLILPTFLFGATFPLVCKLYAMRGGGTGAKIGNIYSVNTVGGIAGSFAGGFILVPFAGMQNTIVLMGLVNVAIGILFMALNPFAVKKLRYIFATASAALVLTLILTLPANMPLALHKRFLTQGEDMVFYREGAAATVMIA
ncbi:MAG: fused MFS/spermidine synthase, partial [Deltaproteobacteria bacterium]|nr:fused MFS/spermidine synthase [Deltaproteobacteria bacterium]